MQTQKIQRIRLYVAFFWIGFILVLTGCLKLTQKFYPELTPKENFYPSVESCAKCHIDIYEEWKNSPHARAFVSESYREQTQNYAVKECLSCHAPDSVFSEKIFTRKDRLEEGVSCISCHFIDGKFAGPVESSAILLVHPIEVRTDFYRSSALCGKCHEGTYQEWLSVTAEKKTCQECHMTPVIRRATQGDNLISNIIVQFENEGHFKRHKFHLSEIENLEDAIEISSLFQIHSPTQKKISLTIKNNIPHRVPTGSFGHRKIVLNVVFLDAQEKDIGHWSKEYFRQMDQGFFPHQTVEETIEMPIDTQRIVVSLQRLSALETISLYSKKIEIP